MTIDAALLADLPAPQRLVLAYAPARSRPATLALLALDARLAAILRARREPIVAQLRLAWWRDTLSQTPSEWPRGEPLIETLRQWRDPSGLDRLASGWEALLSDELSVDVIAEFIGGRGAAFACLARELGADAIDEARSAGEVWALADLAANISDRAEKALVADYGSRRSVPRLPAALRPLAVLAGLGASALRKGGAQLVRGPGSALLALRIGLAGR